jgi:hypothetical protein
MQAATVQVMTERPRTGNDVLVRAVANESQMSDGKPMAGFFIRRRYHGDTFYIRKASEFSARWMEFIDTPPDAWLASIKNRYPDWQNVSRFEQEAETLAREPKTMAEVGNLSKIDSGAFDYSNGRPTKRRTLTLDK